MNDGNEREGRFIYKEGKVEVRTHLTDPEAHSVWIGDDYFVFMRGCLDQYAVKTESKNLEMGLKTYNSMINNALKQEGISSETFALILARAKIEELSDQVRDAYSQMRS